jgi:hypothetical protein
VASVPRDETELLETPTRSHYHHAKKMKSLLVGSSFERVREYTELALHPDAQILTCKSSCKEKHCKSKFAAYVTENVCTEKRKEKGRACVQVISTIMLSKNLETSNAVFHCMR